MDEPTNHLDLEMVHALTRALQEYGGALILVSHDRHLLNNTVDQFLIIRGGKVEFFEGSLDDYEKLVMEGSAAKSGNAAPKSNAAAKGGNDRKEQRQHAARSRDDLKPLRDKVRKLEQQLEREHQKLTALELTLADPALYDDSNKAKLAKLLQDQGALKRQIATIEEGWLLATEEIENA